MKNFLAKIGLFLKPNLSKGLVFLVLIVGVVISSYAVYENYGPFIDRLNFIIATLAFLATLPVMLVLCPETFESGKSTCGTFIDNLPAGLGMIILFGSILIELYVVACLIVLVGQKIGARVRKK